VLSEWDIKQLVREARAVTMVKHPNVMEMFAYHRGERAVSILESVHID
jgi:hypothetical protein